MSALMSTMTPEQKKNFVRENGYVNVNSMVDTLVGYSKTADKLIVKNDITQEYIDYVSALPKEDGAAVYLDYDLDIGGNIYTDFYTEKDNRDSKQNMSVAAIRNMYISGQRLYRAAVRRFSRQNRHRKGRNHDRSRRSVRAVRRVARPTRLLFAGRVSARGVRFVRPRVRQRERQKYGSVRVRRPR